MKKSFLPLVLSLLFCKPYHQEEIQKKHIRGAAKAAGIKSQVGWKTFRHSFMVLQAETADAAIEEKTESLVNVV